MDLAKIRDLNDVAEMTNRDFLKTLDSLGTYEDMSEIITYLTASKAMTSDKLQCVVYFAYAWGLCLLNREIAPFQFLQTPYGPAEINITRLYPAALGLIPQMAIPTLDPQLKKLLDFVLMRYGSMPTSELECRMNSHIPNTLPGREIEAKDIYLFFSAAKYA